MALQTKSLNLQLRRFQPSSRSAQFSLKLRSSNHAFFSILKRGVTGTYHHMSECHLHRETAEFDFRCNGARIGDRADISLLGIGRKRLTYRRIGRLAA